MRGPLPDSDGRSVEITGVSGGVAGLAASYAALELLAGWLSGVSLDLVGWAALGNLAAVDPDLVASAALSPETFAAAEAAVLRAADGPHGAAVAAPVWEALATAVRNAVRVLQACDETVRTMWLRVPEAALSTVPGIGVAAVMAPLVTDGGRLLHLGAAGLGLLYGPETGHRTTRRPDLTVPGLARPARGVEGLATTLAQMSALSGPDQPRNKGTVAVQTLVAPDGRRRHVLYLPGTDDLFPLGQDSDVRDGAGNLRLIGRQHTAYGAGALEALAQAGVRPDEPVLLAGHSQGGMQAAALLAEGTPYSITDVVTLGSPTAQLDGDFPAGTRVLSIENAGDVVPDTDLAPNRDTVGQTTVTFASRDTGIEGDHDFSHYVAGAAAVDASAHPSVVASVEALAPFLDPDAQSTGQVFQIERTD